RVDVDDPPGEPLEEDVLEDRHVAGQDDEADLALLEPVGDRSVALGPGGVVRAREHPGRHAVRRGAFELPRLGLVRSDGDDLDLAAVNGVKQRLEVRALARGEHPDPHAARASATRSFGYGPPVEARRPTA